MKKHRIYIRVSDEEKQELSDRAKSTDKTISEFIRTVALKNKVVFLSEDDRILLSQLKTELRIATNLRNQSVQMRPLLDPIRETIKKLIKRIQ